MTTRLRGRQGTVMRYRFNAYHPIVGTNQPDLDNPYDFTGYESRFTVKTPAVQIYHSLEDPGVISVVNTPGYVQIIVSAEITKDWSSGRLPFEIEMIPPGGESEAFAMIYGVIDLEAQIA